MKVKTPKNSPIAVLYTAAREIVDGTRGVFERNGHDAREIRLPILMHGTDMRVTIEAGPKVAARNAIEEAQSKASGRPVEPTIDTGRVIANAKRLLLDDARALHAAHTLNGEWGDEVEAKALHDHCLETVEGLTQLERLL